MSAHPDNELFRVLTGVARAGAGADTARDQTEAVANAIGCVNWTGGECDRLSRGGECWCATGARAVVLIERQSHTLADGRAS